MSALAHQMSLMCLGGSATDPYFANVSSLMHFDSSFADQTGKVWTLTTGPVIVTVSPKFGGGNVKFNGSGSLKSPTSADFTIGTGDYTIEFWVRGTGTPGQSYLHDMGAGNRMAIQFTVSNRLVYYDPSTNTSGTTYTAGPLASQVYDGNWHHIAVSRAGGTTRAFFDGVMWGSSTNVYNNTETSVWLGRYGGGGFAMVGEMDDYRFTKGIGRYTSNFTPPTSPFPNS